MEKSITEGIRRHYGSICHSYFDQVDESSKEKGKLVIVKDKCHIRIDDEQTEEMAEWLSRLRKSIDTTKLHDKWLACALSCELEYYRIAARMFLDGWSNETAEPHTDEWAVLMDMVKPTMIFQNVMSDVRGDDIPF